MKKTILVSLAGLVLFLAGCTQQAPTAQNLNQPTDDINQNDKQPVVNQNQDDKQPVVNTNPSQEPEVTNTNKPIEPTTPDNQDQILKTYNYKTDAYGFEVKYPNTWTVSQSGDNNGGYANFMSSNENGADICLVLFGYPDLTVNEAEKVLPVLSVAGRKVDSRLKLTINGIVWDKLIIGNQIVLLTAKNNNTYGAQYSTSENTCNQILSSYKITN